jgi:2-polyprenyl-6-methoxyphenol hydroxylase-like FAD-dependent oxidoreductase
MLTGYARQADILVAADEGWKSAVREPIWRNERRRFDEYLDPAQRAHVARRMPADLLEYFTPALQNS